MTATAALPADATVYLVGGAVRDALLCRAPGDRDWVVVGTEAEAMRAAGFKAVGADFPVFLHPTTGEEYALARTERKSGRGYTGFVVHAERSVCLEDDLRRRDFTINAMAQAADGSLVDPLGGRAGLLGGLRKAEVGHRDPGAANDLASLELVEAHQSRP